MITVPNSKTKNLTVPKPATANDFKANKEVIIGHTGFDSNEQFNGNSKNFETTFLDNEASWQIDLLTNTINVSGSLELLGISNERENLVEFCDWLSIYAHPEDAKRAIEKHQKFVLKEAHATEEDVFRLVKKSSNTYCWILLSRRLLKNKQGLSVAIIASIRELLDSKEVASEINKKQEQLSFLIQSLGQVFFQLDSKGSIVSLNKAWCNITGFTVEESLDSPFFSYFKNVTSIQQASINSLLKGSTNIIDLQLPISKKNSQNSWVRLLAKRIIDHQTSTSTIFGSLENINEKYNTDLLIKESNDKLKTILNNSKEIILTINLDENILENVNEAISILGYTPDDWIGMSYKNWTTSQRAKFHELMKLAIKTELQVSNHRITFPNKSNTEFIPFEFSTSIFNYKNSKYLLCVLRDIRERIEYENNLASISNQLSHLISNIDDVYAIYDLKTRRFDFVSDNITHLYDCTKEEFINNGLVWNDLIHVEDASGIVHEVQDIIERKHKGEFFYRINTAYGETKMLFEKITVGKDEDGMPEKLYIVKTDYTHIENAEQSLIETERKFKFISENISDFISIHDPDWNCTYASPSVQSILGYEPEEILNTGGFDLIHPQDILRTLDNAIQPIVIDKKETQFRYRMKAKNGEFKWVETYSKPVTNSHGETSSIISSTRDVTDQVDAENMLKTSEERYRLLSENSNDVIAIFDLRGNFNYVSPSCFAVLGYTSQELVGKNPTGLLLTKEQRETLAAVGLHLMVKDKESRKFIQKVITKSGREKSLEIWVRPIIKMGKVISFQAASHDVTEREQLLTELEQALAKERELNELRAMFVTTASHQFRTPLTVIQSGVEIMELYLENLPNEKQERFQKQFNKIQSEVERLQYLMNDILLLGRANAARTPFAPRKDDLVNFCKEIIEEKYNNRERKGRKIVLTVDGPQQLVDFDPKLLGHVVENSLNNAYKYSRKGNLFFNIAFKAEDVKIDITDQGIGIPEEDLKNLFQPFYRATNSQDIEGTGLGLAIIKEFVDKHGGKIFVSSILNKGTTISVILPLQQKLS